MTLLSIDVFKTTQAFPSVFCSFELIEAVDKHKQQDGKSTSSNSTSVLAPRVRIRQPRVSPVIPRVILRQELLETDILLHHTKANPATNPILVLTAHSYACPPTPIE